MDTSPRHVLTIGATVLSGWLSATILLASPDGDIQTDLQGPPNRPPRVDTLVITPETPDTTTEVTAEWEGTDPDGDEIVAARFRWKVNGALVPGAVDAVLPAEHFVRGDAIEARVEIADAEAWSEPFESDAVTVVNAAPEIVSIGGLPPGESPLPFSVAEGDRLELAVEAFDPDGDAWVPGGFDLPPGVRPDGQALVWEPTFEQAGAYPTSTVTVSDGELRDTATVALTVVDTNRAPTFGDPGPQALLELETLELRVQPFDPDGDKVVVSVDALPTGATFDPDDGTLLWQPTLAQAGEYTITVTAIDVRPDALATTLSFPVSVGELHALETAEGLLVGFDSEGRLAHYGRGENLVPVGRRGGVSLVDYDAAVPGEPIANDAWLVERHTGASLTEENDGSLRLRTHDPEGELVLVSEPRPLAEGREHRFELEARTELGYYVKGLLWEPSLTTSAAVRWLDASGASLGTSAAVRLVGSMRGWRPFGSTVDAPAGATDAQLELTLRGVVPNAVGASMWVRGATFGPDPLPLAWPTGTVTLAEDRIELDLEDTEAEYRVRATVRAGEHGFRIDGTLINASSEHRERAVDLAWSIPLERGDWTWWGEPDVAIPVTRAGVYKNTVTWDDLGQLPVSPYPLCLVTDADRAVALGWPIDDPQMARLELDADTQLLSIVYALGISDLTTRAVGRAPFSLYAFAPVDTAKWGYRSALDAYYALDPTPFAEKQIDAQPQRVSGEGLHSGQKLQQPADYNVRYVMARHDQVFPGALDYAYTEGLLLAHYTRPWDIDVDQWWLTNPPPTYEEVLEELDEMAVGNDLDAQLAAAARASLVLADHGDVQLQRVDRSAVRDRGLWSVRLPVDLDPELPAELNSATAVLELDLGGGLDGVSAIYPEQPMAWFMDGVLTSARHLDADPARLATADRPLTYSSHTRAPRAHVVQRDVEFLRWASDELAVDYPDLIRIGNLNDVAVAAAAAPFMDFHLFEADAELATAETMRATRLQHRFLARHRPLTEIYQPQIADRQWQDWEEFESVYLRPQWHAMMLHAVHPSALSTLLWIGVDVRPGRDVYLHLAPITRELQQTGWEPIPHATADLPGVAVERFGQAPLAYLVVHNPTETSVDVTVDVDAAAFGFTAIDTVEELIQTTTPVWRTHEGSLEIGEAVPTLEARVYRITGS